MHANLPHKGVWPPQTVVSGDKSLRISSKDWYLLQDPLSDDVGDGDSLYGGLGIEMEDEESGQMQAHVLG